MIDESMEAVQSDRPRADYYVRTIRELERRGEWEEMDWQVERPSEEGKGRFIDVFA
jgi:hypothetical protein